MSYADSSTTHHWFEGSLIRKPVLCTEGSLVREPVLNCSEGSLVREPVLCSECSLGRELVLCSECSLVREPVLHTHFPPCSFPPSPEKWEYTSFSPGKISIYSFSPLERSDYTHFSPLIFRGEIWVYTEVSTSYSILPLCTDRLYNQIQFWFRGRPFDFEGVVLKDF
jgi:hypothetical protein